MPKFFSSKSNAKRAAAKLDVAQVVEIDSQWAVVTPEDAAAGDEAPVKQIANDRDPRAADLDEPSAAEVADYEAAQEAEAAAAEPTAPLSMLLQISVDTADARRLATMVARYLSRTVEIVSPVVGLVETVSPGAKPTGAPPRAPKTPREQRAPSAPRTVIDPSVRPVITSASNQRMQALIDRIADARGDLGKLAALNTFRRSATYYKLAGRYLDALVAEASADRAA